MKKLIITIISAVVILLMASAANAETISDSAVLGQQIGDLYTATMPNGEMYVVNGEKEIMGGPFAQISDYDGYAYATRADGSQTLFKSDGSILSEAPASDSLFPPANGIYAIARGLPFGESYYTCHEFELYDYETRKKLCTLDRVILFYLEQQTDKMVIEGGNGKYAFINKYGELQSDYVYDEIKKRFNPDYVPFPHSYAIVVQDGEEKYIDWDLNEIDLDNYNGEPFITQCSDLDCPGSTPSGYKIIESGKKQGILDMEKNEYVIPLQSEYSFCETDNNQIIVMKDNLYGLMDFNGKTLIEPQYNALYFFDDDLLCFTESGETTDNYGIIKSDTLKTVFESQRDYRPVSDGVLITNYSDYSTGYRQYRCDIVNYAGHKLNTDDYISIEYTDGKFYGRKYMTDETLEELNIDTDFAVINLNGKYLDFDGVICNDRTLVPMREIVEGLGGTVEWNGENQTVHAVIDNKNIDLSINSHVMSVAEEEKIIDVPAQIINDKTMLPLRALSEAVGAQVDWDGKIRCVYITK